jgi:hypothetical protein
MGATPNAGHRALVAQTSRWAVRTQAPSLLRSFAQVVRLFIYIPQPFAILPVMSEPQTDQATVCENEDRDGITGAYCAGCGRDRSKDLSVNNTKRTPCPNCGMTSLGFARAMTETLTMSTSLSTSLSPGVQDRDWRLKWQQLEARLPRVSGPRTEQRSTAAIHSATQDLFEFFVSAYHLKDAVIADKVVSKQAVEDAINHSPTLALLADLANLDKHRKLTKPPRSGGVPVVAKVSDISAGPGWQLVVSICHKGAMVDGVAFTTQAVDEWRRHLRAWNLL